MAACSPSGGIGIDSSLMLLDDKEARLVVCFPLRKKNVFAAVLLVHRAIHLLEFKQNGLTLKT